MRKPSHHHSNFSSKIALEVIRSLLSIDEEQFGFDSGKGTTDAIISLRIIIEKAVNRKSAKLWILSLDYAKTFDTVYHNAL